MKNSITHIQGTEPSEKIIHVKPIAKTPALMASFRRVPGVKWWQLDLNTGLIDEVDFDSVTAGYKAGVQDRIDIKKDLLYVPAINKQNASRKFVVMVEQLIQQGKVLQWMEM